MGDCKGSPTPKSTSVKDRLNPEIKEGGASFKDKTLYRSASNTVTHFLCRFKCYRPDKHRRRIEF